MTMTVEPTAQSKMKTLGWGSWRCLQWSSSRLTVFNLWNNWVVTAALHTTGRVRSHEGRLAGGI